MGFAELGVGRASYRTKSGLEYRSKFITWVKRSYELCRKKKKRRTEEQERVQEHKDQNAEDRLQF